MPRRAWLHLDLAAALPVLLALFLLAATRVQQRAAFDAAEERSAQLEQAQNLLLRWRRGVAITAPEGWRIERRRLQRVELLQLHLPDGRELRSLRRKQAP